MPIVKLTECSSLDVIEGLNDRLTDDFDVHADLNMYVLCGGSNRVEIEIDLFKCLLMVVEIRVK